MSSTSDSREGKVSPALRPTTNLSVQVGQKWVRGVLKNSITEGDDAASALYLFRSDFGAYLGVVARYISWVSS